MSKIGLSVKVTRLDLALGELELNDPANGYAIAAAGDWGEMNWRRREVTSPWVSGSFLADAVPDQVKSTLSIEVTASNQTQLAERVRTLVQAFSQIDYEMIWVIEDLSQRWYCNVADFRMEWSRERLHLQRAYVTMQISRQPNDAFMAVGG